MFQGSGSSVIQERHPRQVRRYLQTDSRPCHASPAGIRQALSCSSQAGAGPPDKYPKLAEPAQFRHCKLIRKYMRAAENLCPPRIRSAYSTISVIRFVSFVVGPPQGQTRARNFRAVSLADGNWNPHLPRASPPERPAPLSFADGSTPRGSPKEKKGIYRKDSTLPLAAQWSGNACADHSRLQPLDYIMSRVRRMVQ